MEDLPTKMTEADGLSHDDLAAAIIRNVDSLPVGSVVAIQAAWGRGKTDVLTRVERLFQERADLAAAAKPFWINPWRYGTPNLLAPLVTVILERLDPAERAKNPRLRDAAETLLRAGNAVAFKALSVFVPFGELLSGGQAPVDELIGRLFDPDSTAPATDPDPVAVMADRFCELIDEYLKMTGYPGPVIVCVDDLDRCLPDQQIAMLEAVHFLTSTGANANFIVAIDPRLVQQAAVAHYSGTAFDVDQYLNKLFDLRVNLAALAGPLRWGFIVSALSRDDGPVPRIAERLELEGDELADIWNGVFYLPELSNPRLISRGVRRLELYLAQDPDPLGIKGLDGPDDSDQSQRTEVLVRLIAIAERWPDLRLMLQTISTESVRERLEQVAKFYGLGDTDTSSAREKLLAEIADAPWFFDRLPDRKLHPDLGLFLDDTLVVAKVENLLDELDQKMMAAGL